MSEIEFLTLYGDEECTIVYAGAAPGTHTNYLSTLFHKFRFILIDPAPFDAKPTNKIEIINDFFTDYLATKYEGTKTLFICDIRSMEMKMSEDEKEHRVREDMQMQMNWIKIMKPKASMLKFRLPYTSGETEYLKGTIFLPVWGGDY